MLAATTRGRGPRLPLALLHHDSHAALTARPAARQCLAAMSSSSLTRTSSSHQSRRHIHSSEKRTSTITGLPIPEQPPAMGPSSAARAPLAVLPLSMILRSLATTVVSSSPVLLPPSLRVMGLLAHATSPFLNPDRNPILRYLLKKSFYAQFCAGENDVEVRSTMERLKNIGFNGVILTYAREVVLSEQQVKSLAAGNSVEETPENVKSEIMPWTEGVLQTVRLAQPGDFVGVK
jgi:proline dehydrogenase